MKTTRVTYWVCTTLIVLLEGVMPALTSNTELARQGVSHLGYPDYFRVLLTIFKIAGSIALILPVVKGRAKEWVYAGFVFDFVFAAASHWAVDGFNGQVIFPLAVLAILIVSYVSYHKLGGRVERSAVRGNLVSA